MIWISFVCCAYNQLQQGVVNLSLDFIFNKAELNVCITLYEIYECIFACKVRILINTLLYFFKVFLMTANNNHKINQLKWFYSALSGVCVAYFLALFSGSSSLEESFFLQISTLLFAISLSLFTTFSLAHVMMIEGEFSAKACESALSQNWVSRLTTGALVTFSAAFVFLIGHFSISAMLGCIIVSLFCYFRLKEFFLQLK